MSAAILIASLCLPVAALAFSTIVKRQMTSNTYQNSRYIIWVALLKDLKRCCFCGYANSAAVCEIAQYLPYYASNGDFTHSDWCSFRSPN